ncbi:MAG: serine/threonine protein kinase [Balneolaceae bacterium]|nr:MAG: serine/threonine protein kinase [Balneolaceae bacterium]
MNSDQWHLIEKLFHKSLELSGDKLHSWLNKMDHEYPDASVDVRKMLDAHLDSGTFLNTGILDDFAGIQGQSIGPWRLLHEIGRGGMSTVFLAERADGRYDRQTAIKFLHGLMPGPDMHARLIAEQRILAKLSHPNIAGMIDAGITEDGRPYLILEYIDGIPVTKWCKVNKLPLEDRLNLFEQICEAVQYAHQRLIVHRDLKPSNILVGRDGMVKLLDFGIAKLLDDESAEFMPVTRTGMHMMTPEYASPEQMHGDVITTASDVYSLGLLLCEMLTGSLPYDVKTKNQLEIGLIVTEEVPAKPSSLVIKLQADNADESDSGPGYPGISIRQLRYRIRGDLDNIVLKALRKEPERRYGSAEQLMQDIHRYNKNLPVSARPENTVYRTRKFVMRNRAVVAASVLILFVLIISTLFSLREASLAESEARKAQAVNDFLVGLLNAADPRDQGRDVRVASLLDQAAAKLGESFDGQPDVEAQLRHALGITYRELTLYEEARIQLSRALLLREQLKRRHHRDRFESLDALGSVYLLMGDYSAADSLLTLALESARTLYGENDQLVGNLMSSLGYVYYRTGDLEASAEMHRRSTEIKQLNPNADMIEIAAGMANVAIVLADMGQFEEALPYMEHQLQIYRDSYDPDNTRIARALTNIGSVYRDLERHEEAINATTEAVTIFRRALGDENSELAWAMGSLGSALASNGNTLEAENYLRESLCMYRATLGPDHPRVSGAFQRMARVLKMNGKNDLAIEHLELAITTAEAAGFSPESRLIMDAMAELEELRR